MELKPEPKGPGQRWRRRKRRDEQATAKDAKRTQLKPGQATAEDAKLLECPLSNLDRSVLREAVPTTPTTNYMHWKLAGY